MKILHLCINGPFIENAGYQENILTKYQALQGDNVTILSSPINGYGKNGELLWTEEKEKILSNGIKLIRVPLLLKNNFVYSHLHLFKNIYKYIVNENPDLIFGHDICSMNFLCLLKYKKIKPSVKIVFDNHADFNNSASNWLSKHILHGIVWKFVASKLDKIVNKYYGTTPNRVDFLNQMYSIPKDKIDLLVMGADDEYMDLDNSVSLRNTIRDEYNIKDDDFLIVTGGKIDLKKNIHILAGAVEKIDNKKIKLLIFGNMTGEVESIFQEFKSTNIIHIGWIDSKYVYKYFFASDLVFLPGSHSVLWEQACACKKPIVFGYNKGFLHVNFNNNALFVKDHTVKEYKEIILSLYKNKKIYDKLDFNAKSDKSTMFLYSHIARKIKRDIFNYE